MNDLRGARPVRVVLGAAGLCFVCFGGPRSARDGETGEAVMPCGGCRQAIQEAAGLSGRDIEVVCCDHSGGNAVTTTIGALLPAAFVFDKD